MDIHLLDDFSQFCVEITVRFPTIAAISQALVYNSLNALADYIEIQRDGANLEVRDNGHGISPDLLRQIDNKADRRTLCSLKRISELEVITFTAEFSCWKADFVNKVVRKSRSMRKPGTIIRLKNIFSKIPARLTQFHDEPIILTVQIIEPLLFLTQSTTLKLFDHGHLYCEYRKVDSLKSRLKQVTKISKFHHVKFIGKYIEIEGYVTNLDLCIYHNNYQYLFNNFRPFFNQEMSDRIDEIFNHCILAVFPENSKDFIMKQKPIFPVYIFFVSFPEGSYAVNYTPHQCLKLNYTLEVLSEITIMLREQLFKDTITSKVCDKYLEKTVKKRQRAQFTRPQNFSFAGNIDDISLLKLLDENKDVRDNQPRNSIMETVVKNPKLCSSNVNDFNEEIIQTVKVPLTPLLPNDLKKYKAPKEITIKKSKKLLFSDSSFVLKSLKISHVISQIEKKFILCVLDIENRHVIAAMDQHASHERIKLEEIEKKLHILLESEECMIPLQVSNYEKSILIQQSKRLEKWNFKISTIGDTLTLTQVPKLFGKTLGQCELLLSAHTQSLIPHPILNMMKSKACRTAVKFGDELSHENCVIMCKELEKCALSSQCAHGRPTIFPFLEIPPFEELYVPINFCNIKVNE